VGVCVAQIFEIVYTVHWELAIHARVCPLERAKLGVTTVLFGISTSATAVLAIAIPIRTAAGSRTWRKYAKP